MYWLVGWATVWAGVLGRGADQYARGFGCGEGSSARPLLGAREVVGHGYTSFVQADPARAEGVYDGRDGRGKTREVRRGQPSYTRGSPGCSLPSAR